MEDDFIGVLVQHSPAILEKYRVRVEDYLYMVSSVKNTEIANAIKYHFGWLDQEGNATSSMQGKGIRSSLCMFACLPSLSDLIHFSHTSHISFLCRLDIFVPPSFFYKLH